MEWTTSFQDELIIGSGEVMLNMFNFLYLGDILSSKIKI